MPSLHDLVAYIEMLGLKEKGIHMSRELKNPELVWTSEEFRIVQVLEDNGYPDKGMYVLEQRCGKNAMGQVQWSTVSVEEYVQQAPAFDRLLTALARQLKLHQTDSLRGALARIEGLACTGAQGRPEESFHRIRDEATRALNGERTKGT